VCLRRKEEGKEERKKVEEERRRSKEFLSLPSYILFLNASAQEHERKENEARPLSLHPTPYLTY
jgi:hypothetical protein